MPWAKGHSGNPRGGRQKSVQAVTILARKHCPKAIRLCIKAVQDEEMDFKLRLTAANMLMDRGLGKPAQQMTAAQLTDEELVAELRARQTVRATEQADADERRNRLGAEGAN